MSYGRGRVTGQDSRAMPLRVGEAGRCHVFRPLIQRNPDREGTHLFDCSPGAGKDFVGPAAKQERDRAAVDLVDLVPGFGIDKWKSPSAAFESASPVLARPAEPLHHSVDRDVRGDCQFHDRRSFLAGYRPFRASLRAAAHSAMNYLRADPTLPSDFPRLSDTPVVSASKRVGLVRQRPESRNMEPRHARMRLATAPDSVVADTRSLRP